jgi:hypothetical protein
VRLPLRSPFQPCLYVGDVRGISEYEPFLVFSCRLLPNIFDWSLPLGVMHLNLPFSESTNEDALQALLESRYFLSDTGFRLSAARSC